MAVTINTDMTLISNCDATTGWSAGAVNASFQLEGTNCLGLKVSNNTSAVITYTLPAAVDMTDKFAVMTMMITGKADTLANGGYRIYFEDSSGNNKLFYVGGSDTHSGGWGYFAASPEAVATTSSGTLDVTDITKIGIQMKTITIALGNTPNIFWDICHYGSYIGATSLVTDTATMVDIASYSKSNYYGLVTETDGVYYCRGKIILGDTATNHINFEDDGSALVWIYDPKLGDAFAGIDILSSSTTTTNVTFKNGILKGYITKPTIDATDVDVDEFVLDTMLIQNFQDILLEDTCSLTGCIIDSCESVYQTDGTMTGVTISNSIIADFTIPEAYIELTDSASASVLTDMIFAGYADLDGNIAYNDFAIYVPASITSFTMDNWQFDDPNNTNGYALYWGATSGTLTISATNGTNLTNAGCTTYLQYPDITDTDPFNDSAMVALLPLDTNSVDSLSNHSGTDTSITYTTGDGGYFNEAAVFNGSSSNIQLANTTTLDYADVRVISFSFYLDDLNQIHGLFGLQDSTNTYSLYGARVETDGTLYIGQYGYNTGAGFEGALDFEYHYTGIQAQTWYRVTFRTSGATNTLSGGALHVNDSGKLTSVYSMSTTTDGINGGSLYLGQNKYQVDTVPTYGTVYLKGKIDHFVMFDSYIDDQQLEFMHNTLDKTTNTSVITISQDVTVQVTNVVVGSSVYMATIDGNGNDSTVLINEVATGTTVSSSVNYAGLDYTSVVIKVRNASGTPKYLPWKAGGTISSSGLSVSANQILDTIAT